MTNPIDPVTIPQGAKLFKCDPRTLLRHVETAGIEPVTSRKGRDGRVLAKYHIGDLHRAMRPQEHTIIRDLLQNLFRYMSHPGAPFQASAAGILEDRHGITGTALTAACGELMLAVGVAFEAFAGYGPLSSGMELNLSPELTEALDTDEIHQFVKAHPGPEPK